MSYPVPYIEFADLRGLDLMEFNTIRLGRGWARRLKKGDRVLLAAAKPTMMVIRSARVCQVLVGKASELLPEHVRNNHIELALEERDGPHYQACLAPHRRMESMRRNYGPNRVGDDPVITIIYFKR